MQKYTVPQYYPGLRNTTWVSDVNDPLRLTTCTCSTSLTLPGNRHSSIKITVQHIYIDTLASNIVPSGRGDLRKDPQFQHHGLSLALLHRFHKLQFASGVPIPFRFGPVIIDALSERNIRAASNTSSQSRATSNRFYEREMGYLCGTDVRKGLEDSVRRNDFQVSAEYAVSRPHDDGLRLRAHPRTAKQTCHRKHGGRKK